MFIKKFGGGRAVWDSYRADGCDGFCCLFYFP